MSKSPSGEQADERPIGKAELRQRVDMLLSSFGLKDQKNMISTCRDVNPISCPRASLSPLVGNLV